MASELPSTENLIPKDFVSGNFYDKYGSKNPIVRKMMSGFFGAVEEVLKGIPAMEILEVGCGEGEVGIRMKTLYPSAHYRGVDVDPAVIREAKKRFPELHFEAFSIYNITSSFSNADLVIALEVFEHLEDPTKGMKALLTMPFSYLLMSVPREPLWRVLNLARGKYLGAFGNTPGHLNHWSTSSLLKFLSQFPSLQILAVRTPLPWTMVLCRKK